LRSCDARRRAAPSPMLAKLASGAHGGEREAAHDLHVVAEHT
jgi:hypothetical protein